MRRCKASGRKITEELEDELADVFVRLLGLQNYTFDVIHIQKEVDKRTGADIFVYINSEGVSLKAYDYILMWLSVFWPDGREEIEHFARNSRLHPAHASEVTGERVAWTGGCRAATA